MRRRVTYRGDLRRNINILEELHLSLLQWAFQIRLLHRLACIGVLVDQGNVVVVFDDEMRLRTLLDFFLEVTLGGDAESLASANTMSAHVSQDCTVAEYRYPS